MVSKSSQNLKQIKEECEHTNIIFLFTPMLEYIYILHKPNWQDAVVEDLFQNGSEYQLLGH